MTQDELALSPSTSLEQIAGRAICDMIAALAVNVLMIVGQVGEDVRDEREMREMMNERDDREMK